MCRSATSREPHKRELTWSEVSLAVLAVNVGGVDSYLRGLHLGGILALALELDCAGNAYLLQLAVILYEFLELLVFLPPVFNCFCRDAMGLLLFDLPLLLLYDFIALVLLRMRPLAGFLMPVNPVRVELAIANRAQGQLSACLVLDELVVPFFPLSLVSFLLIVFLHV